MTVMGARDNYTFPGGRYWWDFITSGKMRSSMPKMNDYMIYTEAIDRADLNSTLIYQPPQCSITDNDGPDFSPFDVFKTVAPTGKAVINGQQCNIYSFSNNVGLSEICALSDNATVVYWKVVMGSLTNEIYLYNYCPNITIDPIYFNYPENCSALNKKYLHPIKIVEPNSLWAPPSPPILFSSDIIVPDKDQYVSIGRVWVDQKNEKVRFDKVVVFPFNDLSATEMISLITDKPKNTSFLIKQVLSNISCTLDSYFPTLFSFYSWIPGASYQGIYQVNNKNCTMWQLKVEMSTWTACFALDNSTVLYAAEKDGDNVYELFFYNFCIHDISPQTFGIESLCKAQENGIKSRNTPTKLIHGPIFWQNIR